MRNREWERQVLRKAPGWRHFRAQLAAGIRHHPDDADNIASLRAAVAVSRAVIILRELHHAGMITGIELVEVIGPLFCPDAIARDGRWLES
jgi:hypothetical protein